MSPVKVYIKRKDPLKVLPKNVLAFRPRHVKYQKVEDLADVILGMEEIMMSMLIYRDPVTNKDTFQHYDVVAVMEILVGRYFMGLIRFHNWDKEVATAKYYEFCERLNDLMDEAFAQKGKK